VITRREAIVLGAGALLTAACGSAGPRASHTGSTVASTWSDPLGTGTLRPGPGELLIARTELGPARPPHAILAMQCLHYRHAASFPVVPLKEAFATVNLKREPQAARSDRQRPITRHRRERGKARQSTAVP